MNKEELEKMLADIRYMAPEKRHLFATKKIFDAKFEDFKFDEAHPDHFVYRKLIPKFTTDKHRVYVEIHKTSRIRPKMLWESEYYGKPIVIPMHHYGISSHVKFWRKSIEYVYEMYDKVNNMLTLKEPNADYEKAEVLKELLTKKTKAMIDLTYHNHMAFKKEMGEYIINNPKMMKLITELQYEIDLFEIAKKI